MHVSEARLAANRSNAARSSGPKTPEGKANSRRNGLKHGLTGAGVVLDEADADEVAALTSSLMAEMAPRTTLGVGLVAEIAMFSVRMQRSARQESAAIASNVRNAIEAFDESRLDQADRLFEALEEDPRGNLRKLRRMPEGVDRLVVAWGDLRDELTRKTRPAWTAAHLEQAAHLTGKQVDAVYDQRLGHLSQAIRGDFDGLADHEGGDLDDEARQAWARSRMAERIDAEVAALEIHRDSLDTETIDQDRIEAPERALFDPSKPATLARRYESEARRGFYKALAEFRRVESEAAEATAAHQPAAPELQAMPWNKPTRPAPAVEPLASSWEAPEPLLGESYEAYRERAIQLDMAEQRAVGRLGSVARAR